MRPPGDRENALSWLSKAADAWRAAQSDGALASPDRREMRQVEEALTRIERDDRMVDRISPEGLMMTRDQRELVRLSLDRLSEEADPVTLLLYGKLFELDPSVRRLFHNDFTAQGGKLMDTLDAVVSSLDHFESLRPRPAGLGRLHASYGVRPAHYDALITALLWAFGQALGADFDARTREAWRLALAAIAAVMQEGAATAE